MHCSICAAARTELRSQLAAQSPHGPLVAVDFAHDGARDSQTEHFRADISRRLQLRHETPELPEGG